MSHSIDRPIVAALLPEPFPSGWETGWSEALRAMVCRHPTRDLTVLASLERTGDDIHYHVRIRPPWAGPLRLDPELRELFFTPGADVVVWRAADGTHHLRERLPGFAPTPRVTAAVA